MEAKAEQIAEEIDGYYKPPQIDKMIDSISTRLSQAYLKLWKDSLKVSIAFSINIYSAFISYLSLLYSNGLG